MVHKPSEELRRVMERIEKLQPRWSIRQTCYSPTAPSPVDGTYLEYTSNDGIHILMSIEYRHAVIRYPDPKGVEVAPAQWASRILITQLFDASRGQKAGNFEVIYRMFFFEKNANFSIYNLGVASGGEDCRVHQESCLFIKEYIEKVVEPVRNAERERRQAIKDKFWNE